MLRYQLVTEFLQLLYIRAQVFRISFQEIEAVKNLGKINLKMMRINLLSWKSKSKQLVVSKPCQRFFIYIIQYSSRYLVDILINILNFSIFNTSVVSFSHILCHLFVFQRCAESFETKVPISNLKSSQRSNRR